MRGRELASVNCLREQLTGLSVPGELLPVPVCLVLIRVYTF